MAAYAPHDILRRIDNRFLAEYANAQRLFESLDITKLKQTDIEPIYEEIQKLDPARKDTVERHLRNVATIADKRRIQQLFNALKHDDVAFPEFNKKRDNHDKAMWAFLHHPTLFEAVLKYSFPYTEQRHWQKFIYPAEQTPATDKSACSRLNHGIQQFFRDYDGRGEHCAVQHHRFQDYDYWFAYPSEYPEQVPEWLDDGTFDRLPHRLAFLVIFVCRKDGASVELYVQEPLAVKRELFSLWAKEILGLENVETKPKRSYDLSPFHTSEHGIVIPADSPVKSLAVHKIRFAPRHNPAATYTIEADISQNRQAVYDELTKKYIHINNIKVIGLEVSLHTDDADKETKRRFEMSPSSCSLKHVDEAAEIKQFLKSVNIDVSQ